MFSEYKAMWLMVMFDLPVMTKEQRRDYTRFRKRLQGEGFSQLQYSVYAKFCSSRSSSEKYYRYLQPLVPPEGHVRMLAVTDKQFGEMISLYGQKIEDVEKQPEQLLLL